VRLDFFGDTLESIRSFDAETQRTTDQLRALDLVPVAEFQLTTDTIRLFRTGYVAAFGAASPDDVLYEAVSEGRRHAGMEHWLPLFHKNLETLFDYVADAPVVLEPLAEIAPEATHPVLQRTVRELLNSLPADSGAVRRYLQI
jgi:transcription-repair coupling factor (superfamily II helicase)